MCMYDWCPSLACIYNDVLSRGNKADPEFSSQYSEKNSLELVRFITNEHVAIAKKVK